MKNLTITLENSHDNQSWIFSKFKKFQNIEELTLDTIKMIFDEFNSLSVKKKENQEKTKKFKSIITTV